MRFFFKTHCKQKSIHLLTSSGYSLGRYVGGYYAAGEARMTGE